MSAHENTRFILEEMRTELLERRSRIEAHQHRKLDPDFEEQASEREDDMVVDALDAASRDRLAKIERALARVDADQYGVCERCGGDIDSNRLEAIPYTELCFACASRDEATH